MPKKKIEQCLLCENQADYIRHTQFAGSHPLCEEHAKQEKDFMKDDSYTSWQILDHYREKRLLERGEWID